MRNNSKLGKCLTAAAAILILLAASGGRPVEAQPWTLFTNAIERNIEVTMSTLEAERGGLPAAASAIVKGLRAMKDPDYNYGRDQHRFDFAAVVWPSLIHTAYTKDLKYGASPRDFIKLSPHKTFCGMVIRTMCKSIAKNAPAVLGPMGWPCHTGGAVGTSMAAVNILLFYYPETGRIINPSEKYHWFKESMDACVRRSILHALDLTKIADCVYDAYPPNQSKARTAVYRLFGVAAFPIYKGSGTADERAESYGLHAEFGVIYEDQKKVTAGHTGSPMDQLYIGFVAMLPFDKL